MTTIPFLAFAVILFPAVASIRSGRTGSTSRREQLYLYLYSSLMLIWIIFAGFASYQGWWLEKKLIATYPGLWLPLVPVAVVMLPLLFRDIRTSVNQVGQRLPWTWFAAVQLLRIAAIGTAIKTYRGEFPETVEYLLGIPDLLFGLSALWILRMAALGKLSKWTWITWNTIGFLIIVPFGMIIINLSMPGPLAIFQDQPSFLVAFEFPLALAPTAIVPWMVTFNLWAIASAWLAPNENVKTQTETYGPSEMGDAKPASA